MMRRIAGAVVAVLLLSQAGLAAPVQELNPGDRNLLERVSHRLRSAEHVRERVWPSFDLSGIPLIVHEPGRVAFLFNDLPPYPPGYQELSGYPGIAVNWEPGRMQGGFVFLPIGDREGLSVEIARDTPWKDKEVLIAVHEAFHLHQRSMALYEMPAQELKVHSSRDMALAELEQGFLADALQAPAPEDLKLNLRRFLAVRQERHSKLPVDLARHEVGLESMEGTARYVDLVSEVLEAHPHWEAGYLPEGERRPERLESLLTLLRLPLDPARFVRGRYYETGAAMGLALDRLGADWKGQAERGVPMMQILESACEYRAREHAAIASSLVGGRAFAESLERHLGQVAQAERQAMHALQSFHASPGTKLTILLSLEHSLGVSSEDFVSLEGGAMLLRKGSVVSLEEPVLTLVVKGDSLLETLREADRFRLTVYLSEADARLMLGKAGRATPGSSRRGALNFVSERLTLKADAARVTSVGGEITVDLDPSDAGAIPKRQGPSDAGTSR